MQNNISLTKTSKMPGYSFNLPASACKCGSALRRVKNSVCSNCYACKGFYNFPVVKQAMRGRLALIDSSDFVADMVNTIRAKCAHKPYFRWHDSGDIQSTKHLLNILEICRATPIVSHWLPTKELGIVSKILKTVDIPSNLTIRLSLPFIDKYDTDYTESHFYRSSGLPVSIVYTGSLKVPAHDCPGVSSGSCGSCRACWSSSVSRVAYKKH